MSQDGDSQSTISPPTSPIAHPNANQSINNTSSVDAAGAAKRASQPRPFRFKWDSATVTHSQGPGSVSEATDIRGDFVHGQGNLPTALLRNASMASLALGALPAHWSSSKHGFHAISTVLNNPHKSQDPPKAHSSLPSVPPANLPRIRRKDFDSYLRNITPEWEQFKKNMELGREGVAQLEAEGSSSLFAIDDGASPPPTPSTARTPTGTSIKDKPLPPLESVPAVFFESTFDLSDPKTFDAVIEGSSLEDISPTAASSSDQDPDAGTISLVERLSQHADTIEQHLVREISVRSTSFFAALANLQDLQTESAACLERIGRLRGLLREVDEGSAKRGLEIVRRHAQKRNLARVGEGVGMIAEVVEMTGVARKFVSAGQWNEALGVLSEIESRWDVLESTTEASNNAKQGHGRMTSKDLPMLPHEGRLSPIVDSPVEMSLGSHLSSSSTDPQLSVRQTTATATPLSSLQAFASLPSHLQELTLEIATALTSEAVDVLRTDLHERIASSTPGDKLDSMLRGRLRPLLHGLLRTNHVQQAALSWREVATNEIKVVLSKHIPYDLDEENRPAQEDSKPGLSSHLQGMEGSQFLSLLKKVHVSLLRGVEGLQSQENIIVQELELTRSSSSSTIDIQALQEELSDILSSFAELANTQVANIVSLRSEQNTALELASFMEFFNETWSFVVQCEILSRRMIVGLRGVVVSQAKVFLQTFHQARLSMSAKLVEEEQWSAVDISSQTQHIADILVDSAVHDPPELRLTNNSTSPSTLAPSSHSAAPPRPKSPVLLPSQNLHNMNGSIAASSASAKHLRIEERAYYAVSATTEVIGLLADYLRIVIGVPMLTTDTMSRTIEFLKAFNSRTCQVVLGAGAMRSAGLKNITAKHLALASQSLSIMIALIPYVRETFRRHLSQKQAVILVEFDKLKRDYQEHQHEIHAKLIAIMGDRLSTHIKMFQAVDWLHSGPVNMPSGVSDYMEVLVRETVTLHKVLSRYLPMGVVEDVMSRVFAEINHRLSKAFGEVDLPNVAAKERLISDARYMHAKLSGLKNVTGLSNMLETVMSERRVTPPQQQQQQQQQAGTSNTVGATASPPPPPATNGVTPSAPSRLKSLLSRSTSGSSSNVRSATLPPPATTTTTTMASVGEERASSPAGAAAAAASSSPMVVPFQSPSVISLGGVSSHTPSPAPPPPPPGSSDGSSHMKSALEQRLNGLMASSSSSSIARTFSSDNLMLEQQQQRSESPVSSNAAAADGRRMSANGYGGFRQMSMTSPNPDVDTSAGSSASPGATLSPRLGEDRSWSPGWASPRRGPSRVPSPVPLDLPVEVEQG